MKGTDHLAEALGMHVLESADGYSKISMKIEKIHTNALGFTHGAAIFALADYAFAHACNYGDNVAVALQSSINFVRPSAEGDVLTAEANRISNGKTTGLYHVEVKNGEKLVAFFSGVAYKKT
jgi:acyl-CoA thioesterase